MPGVELYKSKTLFLQSFQSFLYNFHLEMWVRKVLKSSSCQFLSHLWVKSLDSLHPIDCRHRLINTLLPKLFCSLEHFASQLTLHFNTFYYLTHFTPQHTLMTVCSLELFALWNTLLPETGSKGCWGGQIYKLAKCSREQSVPMSRVFQEAKCAEKQSVPRRKVFKEANCVEWQSVEE